MSSGEINKIVDTLAQKLGPMAQQVWDAYVRQQYVIGIQQIVIGSIMLLGVIGCGVVIRLAWRHYQRENAKFEATKKNGGYGYGSGPDGEGEVGISAAAGVIGLVLLAVGMLLVAEGIGHIVNPAYGAVQGLLGR